MFELKSTYLNSAYLGPMALKAKANVDKITQRLLDPAYLPHSEWRPLPDQMRKKIGALLGGNPELVAISTSVSELMSHIADGSDLKPGEEVLLMEGDYP